MNEVLYSICAASIVTALYRYLAPTDKFGSQIKLLLACFFVLTAVNAVGNALGGWEMPDISTDAAYIDFGGDVKKLTAEETAKELRGRIRETLLQNGISPKKIYIDVNISDSGSISIIEIRLVFDDDGYERDAERAAALVRRVTGAGVKVTAEKLPKVTVKERGSR